MKSGNLDLTRKIAHFLITSSRLMLMGKYVASAGSSVVPLLKVLTSRLVSNAGSAM
jgi:hypothetical protein